MLNLLLNQQLTQLHAQLLVKTIKEPSLFNDCLNDLKQVIQFVQVHPKYVENALKKHPKITMILRNRELGIKLTTVLLNDVTKIQNFNQLLKQIINA